MRAAIRGHALANDDALWIEAAAYSEEEGYRCARLLLSRSARPTAIFGANDLIAVGALRAARAAGLRVPGDLSVVGFNDIRQAELLEPPLTTVRVPMYDMGETIEEPHLVLPATLAVRASSGPWVATAATRPRRGVA